MRNRKKNRNKDEEEMIQGKRMDVPLKKEHYILQEIKERKGKKRLRQE